MNILRLKARVSDRTHSAQHDQSKNGGDVVVVGGGSGKGAG